MLKRAIRTLWIALDELGQMWLPEEKNWRLNERHYGALQGLNKAEMAAKFGEEQVLVWRRSYDTPPPALEPADPRYEGKDPRYAGIKVPLTECLKDTVARVVPYWESSIAPAVRAGKRVLIAAHGNSLRALVKHLDSISDEKIVGMNIPTGIPLVYELDDNLKPLKHYYLGDPERGRTPRRLGRGARESEGLRGVVFRVVLLLLGSVATAAWGASQEENLKALRGRIEALNRDLEKKEGSQREARDALRELGARDLRGEPRAGAPRRRSARGARGGGTRRGAAPRPAGTGCEPGGGDRAHAGRLGSRRRARCAARRAFRKRSRRLRPPAALSRPYLARRRGAARRAARRARRARAPGERGAKPRRAPARDRAGEPRRS